MNDTTTLCIDLGNFASKIAYYHTSKQKAVSVQIGQNQPNSLTSLAYCPPQADMPVIIGENALHFLANDPEGIVYELFPLSQPEPSTSANLRPQSQYQQLWTQLLRHIYEKCSQEVLHQSNIACLLLQRPHWSAETTQTLLDCAQQAGFQQSGLSDLPAPQAQQGVLNIGYHQVTPYGIHNSQMPPTPQGTSWISQRLAQSQDIPNEQQHSFHWQIHLLLQRLHRDQRERIPISLGSSTIEVARETIQLSCLGYRHYLAEQIHQLSQTLDWQHITLCGGGSLLPQIQEWTEQSPHLSSCPSPQAYSSRQLAQRYHQHGSYQIPEPAIEPTPEPPAAETSAETNTDSYYILDNDQAMYGPVSHQDILSWQAEGRLNGQEQILPAHWTPLEKSPIFKHLFQSK